MEYIARSMIVHRRQDRPKTLTPEPVVTISPGTKFDPGVFGIPEADVLRLLARGHIVAPEPVDAAPPANGAAARVTITGDSQGPRYGFDRPKANVFDAVDKAIERNKESGE